MLITDIVTMIGNSRFILYIICLVSLYLSGIVQFILIAGAFFSIRAGLFLFLPEIFLFYRTDVKNVPFRVQSSEIHLR